MVHNTEGISSVNTLYDFYKSESRMIKEKKKAVGFVYRDHGIIWLFSCQMLFLKKYNLQNW